MLLIFLDIAKFQSTPPVRGATTNDTATEAAVLFQSTPPVRGATVSVIARPCPYPISIHAPRAGGDWRR